MPSTPGPIAENCGETRRCWFCDNCLETRLFPLDDVPNHHENSAGLESYQSPLASRIFQKAFTKYAAENSPPPPPAHTHMYSSNYLSYLRSTCDSRLQRCTPLDLSVQCRAYVAFRVTRALQSRIITALVFVLCSRPCVR